MSEHSYNGATSRSSLKRSKFVVVFFFFFFFGGGGGGWGIESRAFNFKLIPPRGVRFCLKCLHHTTTQIHCTQSYTIYQLVSQQNKIAYISDSEFFYHNRL